MKEQESYSMLPMDDVEAGASGPQEEPEAKPAVPTTPPAAEQSARDCLPGLIVIFLLGLVVYFAEQFVFSLSANEYDFKLKLAQAQRKTEQRIDVWVHTDGATGEMNVTQLAAHIALTKLTNGSSVKITRE